MQSLLQTKEWAELREKQGWKIHWVEGVLVLEKPLPFSLSFLYIPEVDFYKINFSKFLVKINEISVKSQSIFTRFDFINQKNSFFGEKIIKILKNLKLVKSFEEIQPEYRQIIDISKSEEKILAQMKPKGRYNIKIAQKSGLDIVAVGASHPVIANGSEAIYHDGLPRPLTNSGLAMTEGIDEFYEIFRETAKRDGFEIRPKQYFIDLMEILNRDGLAQVLTIKYNGIAVASGIITFYGDMASYLYGASLSSYRNTMAPYLMHWEAIKLAKAKGCKFYDLLAVSPFSPNSQLQTSNSSHKYEGITRFKEQFGGAKYMTVGSWDVIQKPCWYWLFKMVEIVRRK